MYYIKLGNKTLRGYATAAAAYHDRDIQARIWISLEDFKTRLDAGQILQLYALYVFLDGEPATEDLTVCNKADYHGQVPDAIVPESSIPGAENITHADSDYITWQSGGSCRYAVRNNNSKEH